MNNFFLWLPCLIQELFIAVYNYKAYKLRYGGKYHSYKKKFKQNEMLSLHELKKIQNERFLNFISFACENSIFYRELYGGIDLPKTMLGISRLPIVGKEELRSHIANVYTIKKEDGVVSKTGGTTGKTLEVIFKKKNMQERFACLDNFRGQFGYELGKRTAWFSGKNLLSNKDLKKRRFWKNDYFYKVRYYSTFHIKEEYLDAYVKDLIAYEPEYLVGFPSSIAEIAKYGLKHGIVFPKNTVKAVFPTAETITEEIRNVIEQFFETNLYDQYASSEGAPFIFECEKHNLHLEMQSGIFEVLDNNNKPSNSGRLVVTSFTTEGTPLIRYDIGDEIVLSNERCCCGNNNPVVDRILGRIDDFVYSPENGKINLGNVSNTLKGIKGIIKFQVEQNDLDEIVIKVVRDENIYNQRIEQKFLANWRDRIGKKMKVKINYVENIEVETSGKFRIVKNNVKHLCV